MRIFPEPIENLPEADIPLDGIKAYLSQSENHQIVFMQFDQDAELPEHSHASQWGVILEGKIDLIIEGARQTYSKGERYFIPSGSKHSAKIYAGYADITFFNDPDRYHSKPFASRPDRQPKSAYRTLLLGKIHNATVTGADVHYEGSITIDTDLLRAAGILVYERVQVVDVDNGARLETYVIPGQPGSGTVQLNGAAARQVAVGDKVIIMAYATLPEPIPKDYAPTAVFVDKHNRATEIRRARSE